MNTPLKRFLFIYEILFLVTMLFLASLLFSGCGGGGSSSSGPMDPADSISLVSISFPKDVTLSEFYDSPPQDAPLSQQVVFTFSGPVQGDVTSSSILITSDPGLNYTGPLVLFDQAKYLVWAKGTFEVFSNVVVFTPILPKKKMNLASLHAGLDELPGLLPDRTYDIFLPIGSEGSITNLKGIDPGVKNPLSFKTGQIMYFKNLPVEPPRVVDTRPKDGRADFPVNNLKTMSGHESFEGVAISFDMPLDPKEPRLKGEDGNGDGAREPNIFLRYSQKRLFVNSSQDNGLFRLDRENPGSGGDTFKNTQKDGKALALSDVAFDRRGTLLGLSGGVLYSIPYRTSDSVIELETVLDTGYLDLKGLTCSLEGMFYSVDTSSEKLVRIDPGTGEVSLMGEVPNGQKTMDLASSIDGRMFLLLAEGEGPPYLYTGIAILNPNDGSTQMLWTGLAFDFTSMDFIDSRTLCLYATGSERLYLFDVESGVLIEKGLVDPPWNKGLDLAALFSEMETDAQILENKVDGCSLSINPYGMLPFGNRVEIMVRNRLPSLRGFSLSDADPETHPPLAAYCAAFFETFDPGPTPMEDAFLEEFGDGSFESLDHEFGQAPAIWNMKDYDGGFPHFENLVAAFGLGGSGELGRFEPSGIFQYVLLDTDYQVLPLYDGSTPDVAKYTEVKGGVFNFERIHIPYGITVHARGSNPLVFLVTEDVLIEGTIDVSGLPGGNDVAYDSGFVPVPGGLGGPGGGHGGMGQPPIPPNFQAVTQLQTPQRGEDGWGASDIYQIGGRGGQTGATYDFENNTGVPYSGAVPSQSPHQESRGAGGGGGSMLWQGLSGQDGRCNYVPDAFGQKVAKDFSDGGAPGDPVFADENPDNNFFGLKGEFADLKGGQGGGGGGSRWDSLNPNCVPATPAGNPTCMWDAKGGGGGGGGGALAIHALGRIEITKYGSILARGGAGGGGEQLGVSNFGGAGGGGSGGAVILHSGDRIILGEDFISPGNPNFKDPDFYGAVIDVSGGMMGDAKVTHHKVLAENDDPCPKMDDPKNGFCRLSVGDGGQGGYGIIQLMVDDPDNDIVPPPDQIADANVWAGAIIFATEIVSPPQSKKAQYLRYYETYRDDPAYFPKQYQFGNDPTDPDQKITLDEPPLVDPHATTATLTPLSYGLSEWIDFIGVTGRSEVKGYPGLPVPVFLGFRGTDPDSGQVLTNNGYVVDWQKENGLYNDVAVDAPCVGEDNYIPKDNEVIVEFQGAHPAAPGLHVPDENDMSSWTSDISALSGYTFIRFRVSLNVAKSGELGLNSYRPQVNRVRIRATY